MKNRYFYGTIRPERATNEWQRKNALPERYATATPAEQARMREYYAVSDDECEEMRKIYATFPQHLVFMRSGVHQDEYVLVGWKKEQDEGFPMRACERQSGCWNSWAEPTRATARSSWRTGPKSSTTPGGAGTSRSA